MNEWNMGGIFWRAFTRCALCAAPTAVELIFDPKLASGTRETLNRRRTDGRHFVSRVAFFTGNYRLISVLQFQPSKGDSTNRLTLSDSTIQLREDHINESITCLKEGEGGTFFWRVSRWY